MSAMPPTQPADNPMAAPAVIQGTGPVMDGPSVIQGTGPAMPETPPAVIQGTGPVLPESPPVVIQGTGPAMPQTPPAVIQGTGPAMPETPPAVIQGTGPAMPPDVQPQPQPHAAPVPPEPQPHAQGHAAQLYAEEPGLGGDDQALAAPLVNEEFSWDAAISPVLSGQAPGAPGAPGAMDDEEADEGHQDAAYDPHGTGAAAQPNPSAHQHGQSLSGGHQQSGAGGVPMAHEFVRKNVHGDPLMRRMGRGVRKAVGASGSAGVKTQAEIVELLQRPVPSYRQLAVASVRGGAGKTTMAAMLSTELARHRTDRVLAMDADAELGSLPLRLGVRSELSLFDLAGQQPRTFEEASRYLTRTNDGLWVLSSTRGGRIAGEFNLETFQSALSTLARYISTAVIDCGAGILTELHRGILSTTHGLVLVTPGTVDGALSARGALEWFANSGQQALMSRTVIAMVMHAPQVGADLDRATQMLGAWGLPVVQVPFDRHVAAGAALDLSRIGESTRMAVDRVAYEVFGRALGLGVAR
ncbi:hypothetical protein [Spirillospora sp. NPDC047279]|uniref:MinD/ParA family ATP-binding protein n=1 Tax=Spirillospora sp. NPDC047279 TaxID=3155478 RepID=UPI0033F358B4